MIGTDAFQEIDTYGLTVPITKHNYLVRSAAELLEVMPDAFRIADLRPAGSGRRSTFRRTCRTRRSTSTRLPEPGRPDPPPRFDAGDAIAAAAALIDARRCGRSC